MDASMETTLSPEVCPLGSRALLSQAGKASYCVRIHSLALWA